VLYNQIALFGFWLLVQGHYLRAFSLDRKNSRYSEKDAAVIVRQMLKVAAECHLRGLVHRDMKPEVEIEHFQSRYTQ